MKKILEIALGIVTSVGGFLEIGSIATAAQAGADFSFQLIWAIVLGGLCIIFLVEQAGRFAAVSGRTIPDAIRERFGFNYFAFLYLVLGLVSLLVLSAEIGGVCLALQLATGVSFQWWALPVALAVWLLLWRATFGVIEEGVATLGLVGFASRTGDLAGDLERHVWSNRERCFDPWPDYVVFRGWRDRDSSAVVTGLTRSVAVASAARLNSLLVCSCFDSGSLDLAVSLFLLFIRRY